MKWLNPNPRPYQTALAMIGAKPGQQILMLGAGNGEVAAALAGVTGLNGRTLVVDTAPEARSAVERAAADAGVLVEFEQVTWTRLPSETGVFDVVVVNQQLREVNADAAARLAEAIRVVRTGGRVVVIEGVKPTGWRGRLAPARQPAVPADALRDLLTGTGLRAARVLAQAEGVTYVEGSKPR